MDKKLASYKENIPINQQKKYSFSKAVINFSFIAFGIVGIIGSFLTTFDMDKYIKFLNSFAYLFGPLVLAIATGRSIKNYLQKK